jgi:hypothetical protein
MKLKYKKTVMLTMMCTMGMGLLMLTISQVKPKNEDQATSSNRFETVLFAVENSGLENRTHPTITKQAKITIPNLLLNGIPTLIKNQLWGRELAVSKKIETVVIPEPKQAPVYELQAEGYPEINSLIQDYYAAKISCDIDKMKQMSSNPSAVISAEILQGLIEGIEEYRNITCYTKKSMIEGSYIVYAFHEIKFFGIETPAPSLSRIYVITDKDGNLKMYDNEMNEELRTYCDARYDDPDVSELIEMTNEMAAEARANDEDLSNFWNTIDRY